MQQAIYHTPGHPGYVLKLAETTRTDIGMDQVRVDVLAAPIHNSDLLQVQGIYGNSPALPAVPGGEGVGRVVELGANVTILEVGQTVLLSGTGTWATEVIVTAQNCIVMPEGLDLDQLSMLVANPASALLMLSNFVELKKGDWIVQSAANSAVGSLIIQLAKLRGIKTVNIVRRDNVVADLKSLGGDVVLVDGENLLERVQNATNDAPIRLALDAVGGATFSRLISLLTRGGTMVSYATTDMAAVAVLPMDLIFKGINLHGFWLTQWFKIATREQKTKLFNELVDYVASGSLFTKIDSVFPLSQLDQAVTRAMEDGRNGKVILHPQS